MRTALAVCAVACTTAIVPVRADVTITEKLVSTMGGRPVDSTRVTYIKGAVMRVETVSPGLQTTTVYDLPGGASFVLEASKRRAEHRELAARYAQLEHDYPRDQTTVSLKPTGAHRQIADVSASEHAFSIRVPMTKDNDFAVTMTGSAWIVSDVPGASDYDAFAARAIDSPLVLGPPSSNRILMATARAQTELYRALAGVRGIPYAIEATFDVDGHGMLAGIVRKAVAGSQTTSVVRVTSEVLDGELFRVPDDWKREKK